MLSALGPGSRDGTVKEGESQRDTSDHHDGVDASLAHAFSLSLSLSLLVTVLFFSHVFLLPSLSPATQIQFGQFSHFPLP